MKNYYLRHLFQLQFWISCLWRKDKDEKKLVVGASNVPHAVILEKAKPLLEKKGIELEIKNSKTTYYQINR